MECLWPGELSLANSPRWADFDNWSQLILKYPVDRVVMITKAPSSGIWRMNDKGDISLVRKSIDWLLVSGEDEASFRFRSRRRRCTKSTRCSECAPRSLKLIGNR